MWHPDYQQRLGAWVDLRAQHQSQDFSEYLLAVNHWWNQTPWQPYYLHWDDLAVWPDPWQLIADDVFCGVARALGIAYTIILSDPEKLHEVEMAETDSDNLVLVDDGKYILNWSPSEIVNISSAEINIKRIIKRTQLEQKLG